MRNTLPALLLGLGLFGLALLPARGDDKNKQDAKVEKKAEDKEAAKLLAAKEVHFVFKDVTVEKAVEEIAKKTGYSIKLHDPEGKLKEKKVTLDTGKTTFWNALNQFCEKAGLVDDDPNPRAQIAPAPPVQIQPAPPVKVKPIQIKPVQAKPKQVPPKKEEKKDDQNAPNAPDAEKPVADTPPAVDLPLPVPPQGGQAQGGGVGGNAGGGVAPAQGGGPAIAPAPAIAWVQVEQGQIVLVPGKIKKADTKTSIRVRPTEHSAFPVEVDKDHFALNLELTVEPRLRWHNLGAVKIDKAVDNNDQKLASSEVKPARPNVRPLPAPVKPAGGGGAGGAPAVMPAIGVVWGGGNANGLSRTVPVQFEKGKKETKSLKTLSGTVEASLLGEAEAIVVADNVMKLEGKSVKGKKGGEIAVSKVTKEKDGTIVIEFSLELPDRQKIQPEYQVNIPIPADAIPAPQDKPRVQPLPIRPIKPVAPPPDQQQPAADEQKAEVAKPIAQPAQDDAPVAQPAIAPAQANVQRYAINGLTLQDAKGNTIYGQITIDRAKMKNNVRNANKMDYVARYKPGKGMPAEPAKLVFTGRPVVEVKVPFTLEDVEVK